MLGDMSPTYQISDCARPGLRSWHKGPLGKSRLSEPIPQCKCPLRHCAFLRAGERGGVLRFGVFHKIQVWYSMLVCMFLHTYRLRRWQHGRPPRRPAAAAGSVCFGHIHTFQRLSMQRVLEKLGCCIQLHQLTSAGMESLMGNRIYIYIY